jgi:pimeloyl-ACP methyl ester carboxylesterase
MIILGHSFGGFLSSCYALKYPQHTKALILADTWGYSERNTNIQYRLIVKVAIKLAQYISPFSILRGTGPLGLSLFKKARPDFRIKFIDILGNTDLIYEYIYHSNRQAPR